MTWQPITTAPKDGTRVLLAMSNEVVLIGRWNEKAEFGQLEEGPGWQIFSCEDYWYSWAVRNPVYWLPLPEPPSNGTELAPEPHE